MSAVREYEYTTELEQSLYKNDWRKCGLSGVLWNHPFNLKQSYPLDQAVVEQFNKMRVDIPTEIEDTITMLNEFAFNFVNVDIRCVQALKDINQLVKEINQPELAQKINDIIYNTLPRTEVQI